ncbi:hypothetical protein JTB14_002169 [Gonioctena quinquepunctata]|nr:hypothetical protein JTB14_002169 [Gonioctena quinquepunctata]
MPFTRKQVIDIKTIIKQTITELLNDDKFISAVADKVSQKLGIKETVEEVRGLHKEIEQLRNQNKQLQGDVAQIRRNMDAIEKLQTPDNAKQMVAEVYERQKRMSNIIILNVNESKNKSNANRIAEDKDAIRDLLENVPVNTSNIRVFRLVKKRFISDTNYWCQFINIELNGIKWTIAGAYHSPNACHEVFLEKLEE